MRVGLLLAFLAGCYTEAKDIPDCRISCAPGGTACPDSMICDAAAGLCRDQAAPACPFDAPFEPPIDAPADAEVDAP